MTQQIRILIVDDEKMNRDLLAEMLNPFYKIMVAKNGKQALKIAACKDNQPDLILLDIMMPEMDGYEVCLRLKNIDAARNIPVIFITAMGEVSDERRGFVMGAVDYITKPVSPPIVLARIETHIRLRQMQLAVEERNYALEEVARLHEDVENILRHDLKAPLNTIIPLSSMLASQINDEQKQELLKKIEQAGYTMLNMINRSLDIYRIESGTYLLRAEPTDLLTILRNILEELALSPAMHNKTALLCLHGKEAAKTDELFIEAESMLCYPMFSNLLLNAFEASPEGAEVEINVSLNAALQQVSIAISNQGAVHKEIREHFFDKYITKGKTTGTGLGTYSARLCVETQHGSITMESLANERTRVTVYLPKVKEALV